MPTLNVRKIYVVLIAKFDIPLYIMLLPDINATLELNGMADGTLYTRI